MLQVLCVRRASGTRTRLGCGWVARVITGRHEALVPSPVPNKQAVAMNICNPSAWEVGRQKDQEFKVNPDHIVRFRLAWAARDPTPKQNKTQDRPPTWFFPHHLSFSLILSFGASPSTYTPHAWFLIIFVRSLLSQQGLSLLSAFLAIPRSSRPSSPTPVFSPRSAFPARP